MWVTGPDPSPKIWGRRVFSVYPIPGRGSECNRVIWVDHRVDLWLSPDQIELINMIYTDAWTTEQNEIIGE